MDLPRTARRPCRRPGTASRRCPPHRFRFVGALEAALEIGAERRDYAAPMSSNDARRAASLGVIGVGTMGAPMARNALRALRGRGDVVITGRSRERVAPLLED